MASTKIARLTRTGGVTREPAADTTPQVGQWYWHGKGQDRQLMCVTHVGSNYAELSWPRLRGGRSYVRMLFADFARQAAAEPEAPAVLARLVASHRAEAQRLLGEIRELTAGLGLEARALPEGDAQALVLATDRTPVREYKAALVKAEKKTLPALFKAVETEHEEMAAWMQAELLPLQAQAGGLETALGAVRARLFNVELYAGLTEQVVQVADGAPAGLDEPLRLFQRRAYMDEECLAAYEAGGMEFEDVPAFDRWMAAPANRDRLLPFPRCLLAMQVRREAKEREEGRGLAGFIEMFRLREADKATFLYIRNGDHVFRLQTGIEFGAKLFPDPGVGDLAPGKVYARKFVGIDKEAPLLSEAQYQALVDEDDARLAAHKKKGKKEAYWSPHRESDEYVRWSPENTDYDDVTEVVQAKVRAHNRLVLVLQGLLDRSPVLHPHPPWQLWTPAGFAAALRLLYDDDRALVAGDAPDFEAYRARLNRTLAVGCVTVGQQDWWERRQAAIENARQAADYRIRNRADYLRYQPTGNPGPGVLARVRGGRWRFEWVRERRTSGYGRDGQWHQYGDGLACSATVPGKALLNADAYTPGDFRPFFADPRTRAQYLKWAPLLLEAEEYRAGNRKVER
jgi:hypothetical protein